MIHFWTAAHGKALQAHLPPIMRRIGSPKHLCHSLSPHVPIRYVPPPGDVVLAMGKDALKVLQVDGIAPKGRTVSSLRERLFQAHPGEGHYLLSHEPGVSDFDPALGVEVEWDVMLSHRFDTTGSLLPKMGIYRWVQCFAETIQWVKDRFAETGKPAPLAFDCETLGLSPFIAGGKILSVGFTRVAGQGDAVFVKDIATGEQASLILQQLTWLLSTPMVRLRGANAKFDLLWLKVAWKISCTNLSFDTLLAGSLLNENRSNSLETHTKVYVSELGGYDAEFNRTTDKSRMDLVSKEKLLPYMGGDTDATYRVAEKMIPELLAQPVLLNFYTKVLLPASHTFMAMEEEGILVDQEAYALLKSDLEKEIASLEAAALDLLPYRIKAKYSDNLKLTRPAIMRDYFFSPLGLNLKPIILTGGGKDGQGKQEPSTAKSHLEMFAHVPEAERICAILAELNIARKALSTYVIGFLKHLRADGKFHGTFSLHAGRVFDDEDDDGGTATGRLACTAPALQTIPKHNKWAKRIRACLIAPPGYLLVADDYEQGELKLVACFAEETAMLAAYAQGVDLHSKTAAGIAGVDVAVFLTWVDSQPDVFDSFRKRGKISNFGLVYGMSAEGFQAFAWQQSRLRLSLQEAEEQRNAFFATYPGLLAWYKAKVAQVKRDGFVQSPLGRRRHLPQIYSPLSNVRNAAERQAINAEPQSTLSDMLVLAVTAARLTIPHYTPVATIHDQSIAVVKEDHALDVAKKMTDLMASLPFEKDFGWKPQLVFTADAEIGQTLGTMKKMKFAA
ncbi:DNA polymerase [Roseococcus pinisoli]|uniref:DNA polymerase I n=1 Tax=Roseococcus pinisoli TaxID=2835040 RepID=A0ABS5QG55_9PROT|nr:DNA polymerase [Roseococcus pinisoli]MBS7812363.1 hypothetical protein [Roseococcus pinisoli]